MAVEKENKKGIQSREVNKSANTSTGVDEIDLVALFYRFLEKLKQISI